MTKKTFLYKATDVDGNLLYVGITSQTNIRMSAHSQNSAWYPMATSIEYFEFPDRSSALIAEDAEIKKHRPKFNVMGNPDCMSPIGDVKNLTIRPSIQQWQNIVGLTVSMRTKIQPYIMNLIAEDFQRRGLHWPD